MNRNVLCLLCFLFLSPLEIYISHAVTRYVSTTGNDTTGDGTESNPWASITHATDNATDGDLILVKPGTYNGRQSLRGQWTTGITVRSETPYQARLRHNATVVTCWFGQNIVFEGFNIAHDGPGASPLLMQVQNLLTAANPVQNIVIRNNIFNDSYNNDLLKVNNGAINVTVEGNMFYNQSGSDEHIDINSVDTVIVQDNVFFNDFTGSGRADEDVSSFIVVKDSNGTDDQFVGARNVTIRRNVMLNYIGSAGSNFILFGEDGTATFEAFDCLAENNLLIGNSSDTMRAPLGVKGCRDITFRNNTIVGDTPSNAFAMRLNREGSNPQLQNIRFYNNIWSDPTGTMNDFSDTPISDTSSFTLDHNLYWNAGSSIPSNTSSDLVNYTDDTNRVEGNPLLGSQSGIILPRWNSGSNTFADGSSTIQAVFENLVTLYGTPGTGSAAIDAADATNAPSEDILGNARPQQSGVDIGAVEIPSPTTTYDSWITLFFPGETNPSIIGPEADPDGDGRSNQLEYALGYLPEGTSEAIGFNPSSAENIPFPTPVITPGVNVTITIIRRRSSSDPTLSIFVEASSDLTPSSWSNTSLQQSTPTPLGNTYEQVTYTLTANPTLPQRHFFRTTVESSPAD